ncbi:ArsA family ATPase [Nostoc sp.]|uniref:ArsA family ATPase n=1 Tax=Nostoc sp. TaxID=1180 RepID=UPI002FF32F7C
MTNGMELFDNLHLAMFSGKGGVGKTTISCTFACRWAQKFANEQILLISTDPAHSLGDVLQVSVDDIPRPITELPNLVVRALDAKRLLQDFKERYGQVLELLVERGSFVEGEDLLPVWDLNWPGLDELMGLLEIQRLFQEQQVDRVVVDMAPSGHTLNLFGLMDFLDTFLDSLELFQEKHRFISKTFAGSYTPDRADEFLQTLKAELSQGRRLLQDPTHTACLLVAIAEPMSWLESKRFLEALQTMQIPCGGLFVNQVLASATDPDRYQEQQPLIGQYTALANGKPMFILPQQDEEPLGIVALSHLINQIHIPQLEPLSPIHLLPIQWPKKIPPSFGDFLTQGRRLLLIGGKGGVGKTTVAAAIGWAMAQQHPQRKIRMVSIDPAHSLGDAFGLSLGHEPYQITANLRGQEVDGDRIVDQFRADYLWELAEMMSGETQTSESIEMAYAPVAWRKIVDQALPGIDEILSLLTVMELLEQQEEDLIILDTAPTGHLLRFLEMPTALADWLAWIFKLWIKYQNVLGRTEFMGRLRTLRQRVVKAQKVLKDPQQAEFIGVTLNQASVLAEQQRLFKSMQEIGVSQNYLVLNRFTSTATINCHDCETNFPGLTIVRLPMLPRSVQPLERIQAAATCLF